MKRKPNKFSKAWRRELEQYRAEPMQVTIATPAVPSKVWPDLRKRNRQAPHQSNAVASLPMNNSVPPLCDRRAPGPDDRDARQHDAGRAPITETVAKWSVKPKTPLRPRAPGQSVHDDQNVVVGRAFFHEEADR